MTTVELDDRQCKVFLLLSEAGAWDMRGGSLEIRFRDDGEPDSVKKTEFFHKVVIHI